MTLYTTIDRCRACGSTQIPEVLSLGDFALSDFLESPDAHTDRAPLTLVRCEDCTLVQLRHTVDRDRLYKSYWYRSATQPAMVKALQDIVRDAQSRVSLQPGDVVLDIGSNDGTLLRQYPEGIFTWGVEPSCTFERSAHWWNTAYWPLEQGVEGPGQKAKAITSAACFYDVDDPGAFVEGIKTNLADDGVWINQMAYLPATLAANNFGDICHEHLTYWDLGSLERLYSCHGLTIIDYSFNDVNGGSVRVVATASKVLGRAMVAGESPSLLDLRKFAGRIRLQRTEIRDFLHRCKRDGKSVTGFAAATKFNTALQYWGVGPDLLPTIADRNPAKWERYTPTGQLVISEDEMRNQRPDYLLCGAHHFIDAFVKREADLLEQGTQFVVPFPELHMVGGADASRIESETETASRPVQAA